MNSSNALSFNVAFLASSAFLVATTALTCNVLLNGNFFSLGGRVLNLFVGQEGTEAEGQGSVDQPGVRGPDPYTDTYGQEAQIEDIVFPSVAKCRIAKLENNNHLKKQRSVIIHLIVQYACKKLLSSNGEYDPMTWVLLSDTAPPAPSSTTTPSAASTSPWSQRRSSSSSGSGS